MSAQFGTERPNERAIVAPRSVTPPRGMTGRADDFTNDLDRQASAALNDAATRVPYVMTTLRASRRRTAPPRRGVSLLVFGAAALAYLAFLRPAEGLDAKRVRISDLALAKPAPDAFGRSGRLRMRFALPGMPVDYPIEVQGELAALHYRWVPVRHDGDRTDPRGLVHGLVAPDRPGFYRLEVGIDSVRRPVEGLTLAVLVPFSEKRGASLNGYRIGFYRGERARRDAAEAPLGFVEIDTVHLDLSLTEHLTLGDFVTRDHQSTWPRYAAIDPRLLDKIELVLEEIESWYGGTGTRARWDVDVHSAFRTPLHNRRVAQAARDSRHQLGDALDLAIDANRDGRINSKDTRLVALAVEIVERSHPDLAGGMGLYAAAGSAWVHIDARGQRVRWRG